MVGRSAAEAGYPERHAQTNLGHGSKAVARAYGVLSYNLHVIGRELLARQRTRGERLALAA